MNKPTRFYSKRQETEVAKISDGKRVANSGATAFAKGDVQSELFLIECKTKTTFSQQFAIHKDWITKNEEEAFAMGKPYSAVAIDFGDGDNYFIINKSLFSRLIKLLKEE